MPKIIAPLDDRRVRQLWKKGLGFHSVGGVAGLGLQVTLSQAWVEAATKRGEWPLPAPATDTSDVHPRTGKKKRRPRRPTPAGAEVVQSWTFRYKFAGKQREMGLGSLANVGVKNARDLAQRHREKLALGLDPIREAQIEASARIAAMAADVTFKECALDYIAVHEPSWKNPKHAAQWKSTLETYAYPKIGNLLVRDVTVQHVLKVLEPIWMTKTETADRLRSRVENILSSAIAKGFCSEPNPARWRGGLKGVLPSPGKIKQERHHPAVQVEQVAAFVVDLRKREGVSARALEFLLLTASRSVEVRGACWSEFDLDKKLWIVPPERMKGSKAHFVPLSTAAMKLLKARDTVAGTDLVFPSPRKSGMLSDSAMSELMKDMGYKDADGEVCVPHGLRSTFSDWGGDFSDIESDVTEMALAHAIPNATKAAYRRRTALEKRRIAMEKWARFCGTPFSEHGGEVIPLQAAAS
jgi:integrase